MSVPSCTKILGEDTSDGVLLRRVSTAEEYDMCIRMQHDIWGEAFAEVVPITILRVTQLIGGVTAGAFATDGRLLGFVFGMTGTQNGALVHWSDLLAVHSDARNMGIGQRLKLFQRELLLPLGIKTMFWTYDPLVAKNAHLNLVKLGAHPVEYVVNMYGENTKSVLQGSLGTDRFIVAWDLSFADTLVHEGSAPKISSSDEDPRSPIVNPSKPGDPSHAGAIDTLPDVAAVRIEIPADVQQVIGDDFETALEWRAVTRQAFTHYMGRGYRVTAFTRESGADVYYYTLTHNPA